MKQTAVDWLFSRLWDTPKDKFIWHSILEKAKEMEKEQIIESWWDGCQNWDNEKEPEQYYNETYESE
jgi:hypothetical protein